MRKNNVPMVSTGPKTIVIPKKVLSLNNLFADIEASFSREVQEITMVIEGDEEMKQAVEYTKGYCLGKLPGITSNNKGTNIARINNVIYVDNMVLDQKRKLKIQVTLPWYADLALESRLFGSFKFVTDGGNVSIWHKNMMEVTANSFERLALFLSGMGGFEANDISEGLILEIKSHGGAELNSVTGSAAIDLSGMGGVDLNRLVGELRLDIRSNGGAKITNVDLTKATVSLLGMGGVDIEEGTIENLTVDLNSMGDFNFDGNVKTGSFENSGMGDITVRSCQNVLKNSATSMGDNEIN